LAGPALNIELAPEPADQHVKASIERMEGTVGDSPGEVLAIENNAGSFDSPIWMS